MRSFTLSRRGNRRTILTVRFRNILSFFLLCFISVIAYGQAGSPSTAHRWFAGDGWRQNTADNTQTNMWEPLVFASPNLQPKGIVRCASSAETESGLTAVKGSYHAVDYPILASDFHNCFNQETETRNASVNAPSEGEDIVWFNFDIRPLAGTYQFQIVSNETLGWALYYIDTAYAQPTTAHGATGTSYPLPLGSTSGNPAHLVYADCGTSGNGWSTITVPSFTLPTNYYLAMWINDPTVNTFPGSMNLTYKSRYGCGGSTCTIQYIKDEQTCAENGYQACEWFGGSAGQWTITDNSQTPASSYTVTYYLGNADGSVGAMIGSPTTSANPTITLGTIPDGPVFVKICAVYPYGETHGLTLNPVSAYVPPGTSGYVACTSSATTGIHSGPTAPVVDGAPNTQNLNLAKTNTANLTASASGGTGTITYAWTQLTPDANTSFSFNSSTGNATFTVNSLPNPLPAFYEFKVVATDAIGCSSSETIQVVPLASLEPCGIYGDNSVCEGETGLVYTYGDPNTLTPYTLNTTDFAYKWTISGNGTITSTVDNTGTVTVNTNGDGSFVLTMTIDNITGIIPDRTCTYTVTVNPTPDAPTGGPNSRCFTGTVDLTATGCAGGTLTWYDMAVGGTVLGTGSPFTTPSITTTTTFYVSCTTAAGCEGPRTAVVATVNTLGAVTANATPTSCGLNNGSITITAPLGADITYRLNGGTAQSSPTFSHLPSGVYSIMAMSTAGCTSSGSATVGTSTALAPVTANATPTSCGLNNGSITITAPLGADITYRLNGGTAQSSPTFSHLPSGVYSIMAMSTAGCTSSGSATVGTSTALAPVTANATPTSCGLNNGSITITAPLGADITYRLNGGTAQSSPTFSNLPSGVYSIMAMSTAGCTSSGSATVGTSTALAPVTANATPTSCGLNNGSITITAPLGADITYRLNGGTAQSSPTFSNLPSGVYSIMAMSTAGCTSSGSATVGTSTALAPVTANATPTSCGLNNGSITITAPLGADITYRLNGGTAQSSPTFSNLPSGVYSIMAMSTAGCTSSGSATVGTSTALAPVTANATPTSCGLNNGSITITAPLGADITYRLNGGTAQSSPTFSNLASGVYSIMAMSTAGCTSSGSATVAPSQPCLTYCSYTQGFWGNKNGLKMLPALLTTSMTLGRSGHSFTIPANSAAMLNNAMPGGQTPAMLKAGDCIMSTSPSGCFATQYRTSQGKFNNVLLSQAITLTLNTRLAGNPLLTLPIQSGCLVTGKGTFEMNQNVVNYLTYNGATATVSNLLDLANDLLGGTLTPGNNMGTVVNPRIVPSYSDVNKAIDAINKGFDGCTSFNGYQDCSTLVVATRKAPDNLDVVNKVQVSAYPNPFTDQVRFIISSPVSGTATLNVFNLQGQKVKTIFQGTVTANIAQVVEYHVADVSRQSLVYIVTMNGEKVTGKLLNAKE